MSDWKVTKYVEQACGECVIRVEAIRRDEYSDGLVWVGLLSNGQAIYSHSLKGRLKAAWSAIRGHGAFGFEMFTKDEVTAVIDALDQVSVEAFPPPPLVGFRDPETGIVHLKNAELGQENSGR